MGDGRSGEREPVGRFLGQIAWISESASVQEDQVVVLAAAEVNPTENHLNRRRRKTTTTTVARTSLEVPASRPDCPSGPLLDPVDRVPSLLHYSPSLETTAVC